MEIAAGVNPIWSKPQAARGGGSGDDGGDHDTVALFVFQQGARYAQWGRTLL